MKTALIAGASGLVGSYCLKHLLSDPYYSSVVVLTRRSLGVSNPKLAEHIVDFDFPESFEELVKADDIYCCLGTTIKKAGTEEAFYKVDYIYTISIAKIALNNGASQLMLVSAMGADTKSGIFYSRVKGKVEETVRELNYRSVNIFRPSLLLGPRKEFRLGESIAVNIFSPLSFLFAGPLKKYKPVEAEKVAFAMIAQAKKEEPGVQIIESAAMQNF